MRRRNLIVVFLLISSLVLGVGYAAYTTTLTVNGAAGVSAEAIEFTNQVVFTSAESSRNEFGTAAVDADGQTATFLVKGMTEAQQSVQFTYKIENNSTYPVNIVVSTEPTTTNTESKFTVTTSLRDSAISAGGFTYATVTVVLKEDVNVPLSNTSYVIRYTATSIDEP